MYVSKRQKSIKSFDIFEKKVYRISFVGDTLTYHPYLLKVHPESSIKVVLNGPLKTILTYTLDNTAKSGVSLFSVESNGVVIFKNYDLLLKEIHDKELEELEEANSKSWLDKTSNWFISLWDSISSLWTSDEEIIQKKDEGPIACKKSNVKNSGKKYQIGGKEKHKK